MKKKTLIILSIVIILILIIELGLRLTGVLKTHTEKNFGIYTTEYNRKFPKHLYTFSPLDSFPVKSTEYNFNYTTNRYGLVNNPYKVNHTKDSIVILGDSFTFGAGAPQDSSMPAILAKLNTNTFINAGIPGSDPFFERKLMQEIFIKNSYKHFIYILNISDLYDYIFRGNEKRFLANGTTTSNSGPWYEPLYQYSHIFRSIAYYFQLDFSLLTPKVLKHKKTEALQQYVRLFSEINEELSALNGSLKIIIHPYPISFSNSNSKLTNEVINYSYLKQLHQKLISEKIDCVDLEPEFKKQLHANNYLQYSWPIDGHFNAKGYQLFAEILDKKIFSEKN